MAQNVIINNIVYSNVPEVDIPKQGGGTAKFYDTAGGNVIAGAMLSGYSAYGPNGIVNGSIQSKAAETYNPSSSSQTIAADQYLGGAQTIAPVTTTNLLAQYIASGVVVKVGCTSDDDCVASVTGSLASPVISQDSTSKILSIS